MKGYEEIPVPEITRKILPPNAESHAYVRGGLCVILSVENGMHHLSISHEDRDPTWLEIRQARYAFITENVTMALVLPHDDEFFNIFSGIFHLYQINGANNANRN